MAMPLPLLTADQLAASLAEMAAQIVEMLRLCRHAFLRQDPKPLDRVAALGQEGGAGHAR